MGYERVNGVDRSLTSNQTVMSGTRSPEDSENLTISVTFDDVCPCLVAAYRWSIVGQEWQLLRSGFHHYFLAVAGVTFIVFGSVTPFSSCSTNGYGPNWVSLPLSLQAPVTDLGCITSNTRTPSSFGIGASHGEACKMVRASEIPCCQRASIVDRLNS